MPRYEYKCNCNTSEKIYVVRMSFDNYKEEIPCPCGVGKAKRVFNDFSVNQGLTANEKKMGSNIKRKEMAEFTKYQREIRKKSYAPDTRESESNELWLGKEGRDGVTSLPVDKEVK